MAEQKTCKQCDTQFTVEDEDLAFYKKISPTFAGKTFEIPAPTLCPQCRYQRRMAARNVKKLYKRKCDLCGEQIVAMYPPTDDSIKVYCKTCWWSDKWNAADYARDYDPSRSFFEQFAELKHEVPLPALMYVNSENSDYINFANDNKNSYLIFLAGNNEDVYYGYWSEHSKSCIDITYTNHSELCYELIGGENCYEVFYGRDVSDCKSSYFIDNCHGCSDCILCSGLKNKQFYFENRELSKEDFFNRKEEFLFKFEEKVEDYKGRFEQIVLNTPKRFAQIIQAENCYGDYITRSNNCHDCSNLFECEGCFHVQDLRQSKDCVDVTGFGIPIDHIYESQNIGLSSSNCAFVSFAYQLSRSYCCEHCYYASDLFGCAGIKNHKNYYILNKQYSKEEYEKLVGQIIEKMTADGEWGEFFPSYISTFCYNETMAFDYMPISKSRASELGYSWQDENNDIIFNGEIYEPKSIDVYKTDKGECDRLLEGVLKCQKSGRPYRIMPQELLFYIRHDLPVPRVHYEIRMQDRFDLRNPYKLYHRKCMNEGCNNEFETTYAPDRPEKVYCESCYQKSIL